MSDLISIEVAGYDYTGWKSISVRKSIKSLCGSFRFTAMDKWAINGEVWEIFPGRECRIRIGTDDILTGYVDSISPDISPASHIITVTGRDKTEDLVDCSAPTNPGSWLKQNLLQLATVMAEPFDISVSSETDYGAEFPKWTVQSGETVFDTLSKAATKRALLLLTGRIGNLIITNAGSSSTHDSLVMGENILRAGGNYDYTNRYSDYQVKGADKNVGSGWNQSTVSISAEADDEEITRHRPLTIRGNGIQNTKEAQNQVRWEANIRAAKSVAHSVDVKGYRQSNGDLWEINQLVSVDIPELLINSEMLIGEVEYTQDDGGSKTVIGLMRRDAFQPQPPKTVKKQRKLGW